MTTRSKEEERLLDEKIARIQKRNEEILRREKEIEEDKRLAAKQNAIVQLRSTSSGDSRERTPALRPSKREVLTNAKESDSVDAHHTYSEPPSTRGRGGRRGRDRININDNGPPPDPRSYLADSERDPVHSPRDGRGDEFRGNRPGDEKGDESKNFRGRGDERGSFRGGREFQRGVRKGRGRPSRGRGRDEEAWRAERSRIDEERIQRQKTSDGNWRREWDNEKQEQDFERDRQDINRSGLNGRFDRWKQNQPQHSLSSDQDFDNRSTRGFSGGKFNRVRVDNQQNFDSHISSSFKEHTPFGRHSQEHTLLGRHSQSRYKDDNHLKKNVESSPRHFRDQMPLTKTINTRLSEATHTIENKTPQTMMLEHNMKLMQRSVKDMGGSFQISVPNTDLPIESFTKNPRRPNHDIRNRNKSQTSYSSQSEDEAQFTNNQNLGKGNSQNTNKNLHKHTKLTGKQDIFNKPPLPQSNPKQITTKMNVEMRQEEDGEESWEDVTTSGTESMGEEMSSAQSSPSKVLNESYNLYTPEDFIVMRNYDGTPITSEKTINDEVLSIETTEDKFRNMLQHRENSDAYKLSIDENSLNTLKTMEEEDHNKNEFLDIENSKTKETEGLKSSDISNNFSENAGIIESQCTDEKIDVEKPLVGNEEIIQSKDSKTVDDIPGESSKSDFEETNDSSKAKEENFNN
uniref:Uncharacterized protein n=1 Tax=Clastoptera arizonana TaxID=38151 RepID=A0A1B6CGP5_9HEMI